MGISRRTFLKAAGAAPALLTIGISLSSCHRPSQSTEAPGKAFQPNIWLAIGTDGNVTIQVAEAEMGQGVFTALPMLVAEELDAPISAIRVVHAPIQPEYGVQSTGGSTSIRNAWKPLREAGASARLMLIAAAARKWNVDPSSCRTEDGHVLHDPTERRSSYGELTTLAAAQPLPQEITLKDPASFKLIGHPVRRLDAPEKVNGAAQFGTDIVLPNLVYASVAHPPVFGAPVQDHDASETTRMKGVQAVFPIDSGVAVVADNSWIAMKAARAIRFRSKSAPSSLTSESIRAQLKTAVRSDGTVTREEGNVASASAAATRVIEAEYELPFQAHATMEPMGCTAVVVDGRCEVWAPTQAPTEAMHVANRFTLGSGVSLWNKVSQKLTGAGAKGSAIVHATLLGGGFGRRLEQDFVAEAVQIASKIGKPVRMLWSREEDMQHDFYRPVSYHLLRGGLDEKGMPLFWHHRSAGTGVSKSASRYLPYSIQNIRSEIQEISTTVPAGAWRSVGHSYHGFVLESFIDELAVAGNNDPADLRIKLLAGSPRLRRVVEEAADRSGWSRASAQNRTMGLAAYSSFGSHVAYVAEVNVTPVGALKVARIVCVVDCGMAVNPDTIAAQMESAVAFGLSATLRSQITIAGGRVQQGNFNDFPILRMDEMPQVKVHVVPSDEAPGGIGEPGVPPLAPAVANALYRATGVRARFLPIRNLDELRRSAKT